jgi:uncharacterized protein YqeY
MLRTRLSDTLKASMKERKPCLVATIRLILAALKDRDIAAREKGNKDGVPDDEILVLLQSMVRQRRDSIEMYVKGGRQELADQEAEEITIIESFLPKQMTDDEIKAAVTEVTTAVAATSIKDMGKTMTALRERYAGQMDFGKASALVKEKLA